MASEFLNNEQLERRSERFFVWLKTCEQRFRNQASACFEAKSKADRAVSSLHWVNEEALAHELYIRLKEQECSFEQLFCSLPDDRDEGLPSGKHGPVALEVLPEALANILRVSTPGQVWPPRAAEGGWVILQLEELQPAVFNQDLRRQFALELESLAQRIHGAQRRKTWIDLDHHLTKTRKCRICFPLLKVLTVDGMSPSRS